MWGVPCEAALPSTAQGKYSPKICLLPACGWLGAASCPSGVAEGHPRSPLKLLTSHPCPKPVLQAVLRWASPPHPRWVPAPRGHNAWGQGGLVDEPVPIPVPPCRWRRSWSSPLRSCLENLPQCLMLRTVVSAWGDLCCGSRSGPCGDCYIGVCRCWELSPVSPSCGAMGQQPGGDQLPPESSEEAAAGSANGYVCAGAQGLPRGPGVPHRAETQLR